MPVLTPETTQLFRKIAAQPENKSDPFTYRRLCSHYVNGIITLSDFKQKTHKDGGEHAQEESI